MTPTHDLAFQSARPRRDFAVTYTQSDVDTIRNQIEQTESAKRRWLILGLIAVAALLVGSVILVSSSYALYTASESRIAQLEAENNALRSERDQYKQQLDAITASQDSASQELAEAQSKLQELIPAVLKSSASGSQIATFAQMISHLPGKRVELASKPPDNLFRNWKAETSAGTEIYTLVGGFVDGRWVIHSNLVGRKPSAQ